MKAEELSEVRRSIKEIAAREFGPVAEVFADTLQGDLARFKLLRVLRKKYPLGTCEMLIEEEATP